MGAERRNLEAPFLLLVTTRSAATSISSYSLHYCSCSLIGNNWEQIAINRPFYGERSIAFSLVWSHYSDKHRGMCLGFDVEDECIKPIDYVRERTDLDVPPTLESANQLLYTKFEDWQYQEESRGWFKLDERENGHYFYPFDNKIRLREVIAGPLCDETEATIQEALGDNRDVAVRKARLAFKTFRVVSTGWHYGKAEI